MQKFWLGLLAGVFTGLMLGGCSSLQLGPSARRLVLENNWIRSTQSREFFGYRRMNRMSPVVVDQIVLQGNAIDGLVAYSRKTGNEIWRAPLRNGVEGGVQVVGTKIYLGASDGHFYCLDLFKGTVIWSVPIPAEVLASPTVVDNVVYFESGADVVYALDAQSGKQLWSYNRQTTTTISVRATTRPTVVGDQVYVGFSDGFLVALNKKSGTLVWDRKLGSVGRFHDVDSTPVFDNGILYVSSFDEAVHAIRADTGAEVWQTEGGGYTAVTIEGDRLYTATSDGRMLALDRSSGKVIWTSQVKHGIATQPAYYKGYLIYGESEGALVVLEAMSAKMVTQFAPGQGIVAPPTVTKDGDIFVMSNAANLYAIKLMPLRTAGLIPAQMVNLQ
jgi:outer membrane protein assembly factor BamB